MEIIASEALNKADLLLKYQQILTHYYHLSSGNSAFNNSITKFTDLVNSIIDDVTFIIEWPYVDKMYRDTYYHYYASKKHKYSRVSVKVSIFKGKVENDLFFDYANYEDLKERFLGFFSLRPTFPAILGRNVISPLAFNEKNFICSTKVPITVNGIKFESVGFPHSSQDTEMITCAETTVWSIMEYFGNKYSEYKPLLPSLINQTLGKFSYERLIPSKGLTAGQISYALKDFGFGVKMYSFNAYGGEFLKLLRIYIESGIPVVGAIQNKTIGHAINIIGRGGFTDEQIQKLPSTIINNNISVTEFADLDIEYIIIDDNKHPYQKTTLTSPSSYYAGTPNWDNCYISNFIVPLYSKIYLEAGEARTKALSVIGYSNALKDVSICVRTFLASSRSFKNHINFSDLSLDIKKILNSLVVPKFVWVTEIYNEGSLMNGKCNGFVVLDATEPKKVEIICFIIDQYLCIYNFEKVVKIGLQNFDMYNQNLQAYG